MDQVSGILILHPNFALVDPDNGNHLPSDTVLVLLNVAPIEILDAQDAIAAVQELIKNNCQHGDHVTITGTSLVVEGENAILMTGVTKP